MQLDNHQLREFDNHWSGSYVKVGDKVVHIMSIHSTADRTFMGNPISDKGKSGGAAVFKIDDMEQLAIPAGFYGEFQNFFMYSRTPVQGTKRGVARTNAFCLKPVYDGRTLSSSYLNLDPIHVAQAFVDHYRKPKWETHLLRDYARYVSETGYGFSIGKNYAGLFYRSPKQGGICALTCNGGMIGQITYEGKVVLAKKLEHMQESVLEELSARFNQEVAVHVQ